MEHTFAPALDIVDSFKLRTAVAIRASTDAILSASVQHPRLRLRCQPAILLTIITRPDQMEAFTQMRPSSPLADPRGAEIGSQAGGMHAATAALRAEEHARLIHRVKLISWIGLGWLLADGAIGMTAGITANSVALIGWGLDCAIQAVASAVIIWRFTGDRIHSGAAELKAQRVVAVSFFLLAPYIVVEAIDHLATGNASHKLARHRPRVAWRTTNREELRRDAWSRC